MAKSCARNKLFRRTGQPAPGRAHRPADQERNGLAALIPLYAKRLRKNVARLGRAAFVKRDQGGFASLRTKCSRFFGLSISRARGTAFRNFNHFETRYAQRSANGLRAIEITRYEFPLRAVLEAADRQDQDAHTGLPRGSGSRAFAGLSPPHIFSRL